MATHSGKKRRRTNSSPGSVAGRGDSGKSDRRAPLPPTRRATRDIALAGARKSKQAPSKPLPEKPNGVLKGPRRERQPHGSVRWGIAGGDLLRGQRCCVACGIGDGDGDPTAGWKADGARVRCAACDGEYHPGCLDPHRPYVPKRAKGEEEGWVCGVCDERALYSPSGGPVPGHPESRPSSGAEAGPTSAATSLTPQRQRPQQHQQHQQPRAVASHARFVDVMSSALTRLAGLSDSEGPRGGSETASATGTIVEAAVVAAARRASKVSGRRSQKREDIVSMSDGLLAWALQSVGGTGEEGKPRGNLDGRNGDGNIRTSRKADRGRTESGGSILRVSSVSPVAGGRQCEANVRRRKAGDQLPEAESEGSLGDVEGKGSGDDNSGMAGECASDGGSAGDGSGHAWRSASSLPSLGPRAKKQEGMARSHGEASLESFGDVDVDGGGSEYETEGEANPEEGKSESDERKEPGFWDVDENTRFLQGVTKHGDAWARLARKHAESGVVGVAADTIDDHHGDGDDHDDYGHDYDEAGSYFGGGGTEGAGLGEAEEAKRGGNREKQRHRAVTGDGKRNRGTGGEEEEEEEEQEQQQNKHAAVTSAGEAKRLEKRKRQSGVKKRKRRRDCEWREEEHARFVDGFKKHGNAWADVARVVRTRDRAETERHAKRWVDRGGKQLRDEASAIRTGEWDDDEHSRFLEGFNRYGRSWLDIARVVRTRTNAQTRIHAQYLFKKGEIVMDRLQRATAPTPAHAAPGEQKTIVPNTGDSAPVHGTSPAKGLRAGTVAAAARASPRKAAAEAIVKLQSASAAAAAAGSEDGRSDDDDDDYGDDDDGGGGGDDDDDDDGDYGDNDEADTDNESTLSVASSCAAPEAAGGRGGGVDITVDREGHREGESEGAARGGGTGGRRRGEGEGEGGRGKRRSRPLSGQGTREPGAGEGGRSRKRARISGNGKSGETENDGGHKMKRKSEGTQKHGRARYRYWDEDEHERFLKAYAKYGNSWLDVARAVGTRTRLQVYNHAQGVLKRRKTTGQVDSEERT